MLLSLFALVAATLATIGIYGTLTYVVTARRRELGLRLALGETPREIVRRYLLRGFSVSLAGCIAGLCLAGALTRMLAGMLYGVTSTDPETFITVPGLLLVVGLLASLWPSVRAARVDPMQVLLDE